MIRQLHSISIKAFHVFAVRQSCFPPFFFGFFLSLLPIETWQQLPKGIPLVELVSVVVLAPPESLHLSGAGVPPVGRHGVPGAVQDGGGPAPVPHPQPAVQVQLIADLGVADVSQPVNQVERAAAPRAGGQELVVHGSRQPLPEAPRLAPFKREVREEEEWSWDCIVASPHTRDNMRISRSKVTTPLV